MRSPARALLVAGLTVFAVGAGRATAPVSAPVPAPVPAFVAGPAPATALRLLAADAPRPVVDVTFANGDDQRLVLDDAGRPRLIARPADAPDAAAIAPPADVLPGSRPGLGVSTIESAWLVDPTDRYPHGALGDNLEAAGLRIRPRDGADVTISLDGDAVFEDLEPRIVDLDLDGREEVLTMLARPGAGAALVAYGLRAGAMKRLGATPPIGETNRWLNPIGVGDLDGDATMEAIYVETPHSGGIVKVWSFIDGAFVFRASAGGYSNHAYGSPALGLGRVMDVDLDGRDEILVPDQPRTSLVALAMDDDRLIERWRIALGARLILDLQAVDFERDGRPELLMALADGRLGVLDFDR